MMKKYWQQFVRVLFIFCISLFVVIAASGGTPVIKLRYCNVMLLQVNESDTLCVTYKTHGAPQRADTLSLRLCESSGREFLQQSATADNPAVLPIVPRQGRSNELQILEFSGSNLAMPRFENQTPWALVANTALAVQSVGEWGPLYFYVPEDVRKFSFWVHASARGEAARIVVRDPDGKIVLDQEDDFDKRTRLECSVSANTAGAPWSVAVERCQTRNWYVDDVVLELGNQIPGVLTPRAEWLPIFIRYWEPDVKATALPKAPTLPTLPPWQHPDPASLDLAYTRKSGKEWRTTLPVTYVLDYGAAHLSNTNYVTNVAIAPPALLHLGKDVVFNHAWGCIRATGGENVAHGYGDAIIRLTPAEAKIRQQQLSQMVDGLHRAGVRWVMPYVCSMTLNGDPEKRSGFWEFYDHWQEYQELGLGERPLSDPIKWLQTRANGKPYLYYNYNMKGFYPPFKENHRFAACWHHEGWRTWLLEVIASVARTGCDGVFVDNGSSQKSESPLALQAFRQYIKKHYTSEQVHRLLGVDSVEKIQFPLSKATDLLSCELRRFWSDNTFKQMRAIREHGSTVLGREFAIFANGGFNRPAEIQRAMRDCDFIMFEKSSGTHGTHPGTVRQPVFGSAVISTINDNICDYLYVRGLRTRVQPLLLTSSGSSRSLPHRTFNPDIARLGMAECAAFSGGGAFLVRSRFNVYGDALNEYRAFFESLPHLFAGLQPYADVALLTLAEHTWVGRHHNFGQVKEIVPLLAARQINFEMLAEQRLQLPNPLQDFKVVLALTTEIVSDQLLAILEEFVAQGGKLLVADAFATHNEWLEPRTVFSPFMQQINTLKQGGEVQIGKGRVCRVTTLADAVQKAACSATKLTLCNGDTSTLRTAIYHDTVKQRWIMHVVNYGVEQGRVPVLRQPVRRLSITLPHSVGQGKITHAQSYTPVNRSATQVLLQNTDNGQQILLPETDIYTVIELVIEP